MALFIDARIPVVFARLSEARATDAVLLEGDAAPAEGLPVARFVAASGARHGAGCLCCAARAPSAEALGRLFLARVRGEVRHFDRVVACVRDEAALRAVLVEDPLVAARFRAQ